MYLRTLKRGRQLRRVYRSRNGDINLGIVGHEDPQKVKETLRYLDSTIHAQEDLLEGYREDYHSLLDLLPKWEKDRWLGRKRTPEL